MKHSPLLVLAALTLGLSSSDVSAGDRTRSAVRTDAPSIEASTTMFLSLPPETLLATRPNHPRKFITPVKRRSGRYPNWANLRDETVAQGGFQPGASQSDSAAGMRIGISFVKARRPGHINPKWKPVRDSAKVYCWIRLTEWKWWRAKGVGGDLIPKTLRSQGVVFHTGPARGLDSTGVPGEAERIRLSRERKKLEPIRSSNKLFPELVALKLNIAMSELGKTPAGFGDLVFDQDGSSLDELTVRGIAARADTMMTRWELFPLTQFDSLWTAVSAINRAFAGRLDTLTWLSTDSLHPNGNLTVLGQVDIATVPFLRLPVPFIPVRLAASSSEVECDPVFGDEEFTNEEDEADGSPVAVTVFQNYPNPFNPTTQIAFQLSAASRVTIRVFDVLGREVALLLDGEEMDSGSQSVEFTADNLASGVYLYQVSVQNLESGGGSIVTAGKMMLMR
jgi:hypothetical protein